MYLEGLAVCVGYDDLLIQGWSRWVRALDRLIVVTAPHDTRTQGLCDYCETADCCVECFCTNAFYRHGSHFNKGLAIAEAISRLSLQDWLLFFDADIVPPADLRERLTNVAPQVGWLHGPWRRQCDSQDTLRSILESGSWDLSALPRVNDGEMAGYFQMFHAADQHLSADLHDCIDTQWPHAGGYDSQFQARWPRKQQARLPFEVVHLGPHGENWHGRASRRWDDRDIRSTGGLDACQAARAQQKMLTARQQGRRARKERITS
jgi:hypothetical protein